MHPIQRVYNAAVWAAQPFLRRKLARRAQAEPVYGLAVPERFGHYTQTPEMQSALVWVHAVSLGETRAAEVLIHALRLALPGMRLLLTNGTATGRSEGERLLEPGDIQVWQPWDTPSAVQRFLTHFKPRIGVLIETEVWPNLVLQSQKNGVPLVLANARMSERSSRKALRWPALTRPVFQALTAVWPQTESDAQRLQQLGVRVQTVMGNIKFDAQPDALQCAQGLRWRLQTSRPIAMLASSREGEEAAWLESWLTLRQAGASVSDLQWLIVPRHPQRVNEVETLLISHGLTVSRRSQWCATEFDGPDAPTAQVDVWLGDSLGEMALYYSMAKVALLGGSFAPLGGQNLIEAAACGCPVIMGPHTFNFEQAAEMADQAGVALRVVDMTQALEKAHQLLHEASSLVSRSELARAFAKGHEGATERTAQAVIQTMC